MQLWQPSQKRIQDSNLFQILREVNNTQEITLKSQQDIYEWSIQDSNNFWSTVWDFTKIKGFKGSVVSENNQEIYLTRWFPEAKLNFAENLLWRKDSRHALIFWGENQSKRSLTYAELNIQVAAISQELVRCGVKAGDRVAALVANTPESVVCMLAAASLGAIWSSCSPDFGVQAACDRFEQIEPKIFFYTDGYFHKGRWFDCSQKCSEIAGRLKSLQAQIVVPYEIDAGENLPANSFSKIVKNAKPQPISFTQLPFDHPLYIMFSSGTTGKPKCIVHRAGGVLIEHKKELALHTDLKESDVFFYQTTCSWMMWNWLVSGLSQGCSVVLYDGSPILENGKILLDLMEQEQISIFGTNPRFLATLQQAKISIKDSYNLKDLRTILSTGSPLLPEQYDYVYSEIKEDLALQSISGGTDIIGCFALGSPLLGVNRGELQCRSLGYEVDVFNERGEPIQSTKGELVCKNPFPSMPLGFWNDPDGTRFTNTYFARYPNIWHHGDYVELTPQGAMIFYGRSDAVLNPGGVRIGTAEIYRQVETIDEIEQAVVVGQIWNDDIRVVLFVKLNSGIELTPELQQKIRQQIRTNASPFHVPKKILSVPDIPRTHSGKTVELAVRDTLHGEEIKNIDSLANPEALDYFRDRPELQED